MLFSDRISYLFQQTDESFIFKNISNNYIIIFAKYTVIPQGNIFLLFFNYYYFIKNKLVLFHKEQGYWVLIYDSCIYIIYIYISLCVFPYTQAKYLNKIPLYIYSSTLCYFHFIYFHTTVYKMINILDYFYKYNLSMVCSYMNISLIQ